jgi:hypothetical protein
MPAIAGDGEFLPGAFAIRTAIIGALRHRAFTAGMGALVGFSFRP